MRQQEALNSATFIFVDYFHTPASGASRKQVSVPYAPDDDDTSAICVKGFKPVLIAFIKRACGKIGEKQEIRMKLSIGLEEVLPSEESDLNVVRQVDNTVEFRAVEGWLRRNVDKLEKAGGDVLVRVGVKPGDREGLEKKEPPRVQAVLLNQLKAKVKDGAPWTIECDELLLKMERSADKLSDFESERRIVTLALGDKRWLINPVTFACPFANCQLRHSLNSLNRVEYMYDGKNGHLLTKHRNDPAAAIIVERFKW